MCLLYRYIPILKARQPELSALAVTSNQTLSEMIPLLEIMNFPTAVLNKVQGADSEIPPPAIEKHIFDQLNRIADALPQKSKAFIDIYQLSRDILWRYPYLTRKAFLHLFLRGICAIPVIHADTPAVILAELKEIQEIIDCGYMIRLNRLDLPRINEFQAYLECKPDKIDLLLDYGAVVNDKTDALVASAAGFINHWLPCVMEWRSLTLAAGAFPASVRGHSQAAAQTFARLDSRFWRRLIQQGVKRNPWLADYGVLNPLVPAPRGKYSSMVGIPYTTSDQWILLQGDKANRFSLRNGCRQLLKSIEYDGKDFSYADRQLLLFALDEIETLDSIQRRIIAYNRHFEKICSMLPN